MSPHPSSLRQQLIIIIAHEGNLIETLDHVGTKEHRSRAALIREAVNCYLKEHYVNDSTEAYGIWKNDITDGVEYQRNIRSAWGD